MLIHGLGGHAAGGDESQCVWRLSKNRPSILPPWNVTVDVISLGCEPGRQTMASGVWRIR